MNEGSTSGAGAGRPVRSTGSLHLLRDRGVRASLVFVAVAAAGFVMVSLAWRGVAAKLTVSLQLPFVASAGLGGAALAGTGATLLAVHLERRAAAERRAELDKILRTTVNLAEALRRRTSRLHRLDLVALRSTVHRRECRVVAARDDVVPTSSRQALLAGWHACRVCRPLARS